MDLYTPARLSQQQNNPQTRSATGRRPIRIIQDFSKLSGLQANLEKTSVTPIGGNFSIEKVDQIWQDLKLDCKKEFTLLGILIDGELK